MSEKKDIVCYTPDKCEQNTQLQLPSINNINHNFKCGFSDTATNEEESETWEDVSYTTEDTQSQISDISCQKEILDGCKYQGVVSLDDVKNALANVSLNNCENVVIGTVTKIYKPVKIKKTVQTIVEHGVTNEIFLNGAAFSKPTRRLSIVDQLNWLAQDPIGRINYLIGPAKYVILCHTATKSSITQADNALIVRLIQSNHIEGEQWSDISYNFLIGCDGKVYEGRGWGAEGDHTAGYNNQSIGIAFVGTFTHSLPSEPALHQAKVLIAHGVEIGAIDEDYVLVGHRQCISTESPGKALFDEIRTWDRWTNELP